MVASPPVTPRNRYLPQSRLVDAGVVLLARLHLDGVYWGDCSLPNLLFRRDAGALMAYLVDAETAERHQPLPDGMRARRRGAGP